MYTTVCGGYVAFQSRSSVVGDFHLVSVVDQKKGNVTGTWDLAQRRIREPKSLQMNYLPLRQNS